MKIKYIILILVVILIIVLGGFLMLRKKIEITKINSFYLTYSNGYAMNSYTRYELKYNQEENKWVVMIKPYGILEEEKMEVEVDEKISEEIKNILAEYHVEKWDGFNKSDKNVLDGDSFSLSVRMDDENSISASGYMTWPNNYRDVRDKISEIFMKIYNENKHS